MIISEPSPARRAVAARLGFTHVVEPAELRSVLDELTRGLGADVVYECIGFHRCSSRRRSWCAGARRSRCSAIRWRTRASATAIGRAAN
ncbi:zinc-binding dehydrogenase [Micromonospora globispora]|uniref:zinc-binding dehydrogenase n=1 Tax=Micromonospora globispora TaxID=1450148 RepID=UPI001A9C9077